METNPRKGSCAKVHTLNPISVCLNNKGRTWVGHHSCWCVCCWSWFQSCRKWVMKLTDHIGERWRNWSNHSSPVRFPSPNVQFFFFLHFLITVWMWMWHLISEAGLDVLGEKIGFRLNAKSGRFSLSVWKFSFLMQMNSHHPTCRVGFGLPCDINSLCYAAFIIKYATWSDANFHPGHMVLDIRLCPKQAGMSSQLL